MRIVSGRPPWPAGTLASAVRPSTAGRLRSPGSAHSGGPFPPSSPPASPHRTHTEEFHQITLCSLSIAELNRELQSWERTYNTVRPHQALGYLTPQEFLAQSLSPRKELECH